jgi:hypothetical protein
VNPYIGCEERDQQAAHGRRTSLSVDHRKPTTESSPGGGGRTMIPIGQSRLSVFIRWMHFSRHFTPLDTNHVPTASVSLIVKKLPSTVMDQARFMRLVNSMTGRGQVNLVPTKTYDMIFWMA